MVLTIITFDRLAVLARRSRAPLHITRRHALRRYAPRPPRPKYEDGRSGTFSPSLRYGENVAYAGNVGCKSNEQCEWTMARQG